MSAFDRALKHTLGIEGGYVDDPTDRGGATRYGITEKVARGHGYAGPMSDLPKEQAIEIYRLDYWDENKLDSISAWDESVAAEMFDTGINQGVRHAGRYLQRALNVMNRSNQEDPLFEDVTVDGLIGPQTIRALHFIRSEQEHHAILTVLNILQGARYVEIMERDPTQEKYARGWLDRVEFRRVSPYSLD